MSIRRLGRFEGGGSSILVIFLMLLLVTLGSLSVASSHANLKLARKGVSWVNSYYALEAGGEVLLDIISQILAQAGGLGRGKEDTLARMLADCLDEYAGEARNKLPYDTIIGEVRVEPDGPGSITVTTRLSRQHGSTGQHLLVEIQVVAGSGEPDAWGFRILQWKQYQEPFEYESAIELWNQPE
ncbi:MAG: hypothetical protein ACOX34_06275 [Bacillota bacterium]